MNAAAPHSATEHPRSEARRAQILTAAEDCFRKHGFHGASIAQISKESGMSAGHIYHYFENKEAIIGAIVEKDVERLVKLTTELRSAADVLEALIDGVGQGVRDNLDEASAGLKLEIVAEASRNPRVAEIVRVADGQCLSGLTDMIRCLRRSHARAGDDGDAEAVAEVIAAMFEGLMVRRIRNPELDAESVTRTFQRTIRTLITG